MADRLADPRSLLAWGLATFHTTLLVTSLALGLHLAGAAGDILSGLGTWIGVPVYLYLWAVTWWTNRRWLDALPGSMADPSHARPVIVEALKWGGVAGGLFFLGPLVPAVAFFVAGGGLGAIPFVLLVAAVGGVLSFVVGAGVGGLFASVDLLLLRASALLVPSSGPAAGSDIP